MPAVVRGLTTTQSTSSQTTHKSSSKTSSTDHYPATLWTTLISSAVVWCSTLLASRPREVSKQKKTILIARTNVGIDTSTTSACSHFATFPGPAASMCRQFAISIGDTYARVDGGRGIRDGQGALEERGKGRILVMGLEGTQDWSSEEEVREEADIGGWT